MPRIETALGPIDAKDLGFTLSHEHIAMQHPAVRYHYPWLADRAGSIGGATRELIEAKAGGVDAVIELSTPDLGRDVELVAEVSRASGVHAIVATGLWRDIPRYFWTQDPDAIAEVFVREIEVGIADSGIRAGVIKIANDAEGVTPEGERVLRAAARTAKRTGVPISTHHWARRKVGLRQLSLFQDEKVPPHLVCIGHSADSTDVGYLEELLRAGVYVSMDRYPGRAPMPEWQERNATVRALIDRGWAGQLMLGHDYARDYRRPAEWFQEQHYLFLSRTAIPGLLADGVAQEAIDMMMREVPRRFLTGEPMGEPGAPEGRSVMAQRKP
jgi:phosphotriesterase-related protein